MKPIKTRISVMMKCPDNISEKITQEIINPKIRGYLSEEIILTVFGSISNLYHGIK
jgi:hypothetical protein